MARQLHYSAVSSPILSVDQFAGVYYDPGVTRDLIARRLEISSSQSERCSPCCLAALYVISLYGMRASEYLGVLDSDVRSNDMVFVRGAKGSAAYQVFLPGIYHQFRESMDLSLGRIVSGITYHSLWESCVRAGIGELLKGHSKMVRTHIFRHRLADAVRLNGESAVSDCLHHRSLTSAHYYGVKRG